MEQRTTERKELKIKWEKLRAGFNPALATERSELAARALRERLMKIPYYAERDSRYGMRYWRTLQACEYPIG